MSVLCNDFIFHGKNMNDFKINGVQKYIFVDFEQNPPVNLGMDREMDVGSINRYRNEPNYSYDKWTSPLQFEFHIVKNPDIYKEQSEMELTKDDINEITKWLTSSHLPQWLKTDNDYNKDNLRYKGFFKNIEAWAYCGIVYGLKLFFQCTSSFAYTEDIVNEGVVSSYKYELVKNNSDEQYNYCYPTIDIYPISNCDIYICNLSDCDVLENKILGGTKDFNALTKAIENYAFLNGLIIKNNLNIESGELIPICNNTACQFYYVDRYGESMKCTAFFLPDTSEYRIIVGGFMYMKILRDLPIHIDCKKLMIYDDLQRMVTYDKLGINDADFIYWLRLINGNNSILLNGNFKYTIKHIDSRKVGE